MKITAFPMRSYKIKVVNRFVTFLAILFSNVLFHEITLPHKYHHATCILRNFLIFWMKTIHTSLFSLLDFTNSYNIYFSFFFTFFIFFGGLPKPAGLRVLPPAGHRQLRGRFVWVLGIVGVVPQISIIKKNKAKK